MLPRILASWLAALSVVASSPTGNPTGFTSSCTNITLIHNDYTLGAHCPTTDGKTLNNSLDLNLCIGIDHTTSVLQWGVYGKLSVYCPHCWVELEPPTLSCGCKSTGSSGPEVASYLLLDNGISNNNGTLTCVGGQANILW